VKNADSRYAKRFLSTGACRPATTGFAHRSAASPAGSGTGASANRLVLGLLALAVAAFAFLNPAPASADTRHPAQTLEFGSDGTSATKFNVELKSVTYDQRHNRLYVLVGPTEGEFAKIYGFDNPSAGVYTPRAGFPIKVQWPYWEPTLVVDDTNGPNSGRIYFVSKFSSELKAYEPDGTAAPSSWPVKFPATPCDAEVDADGNVWVSQGFPDEKLLQISGDDGSQLAEFPLPFTPCHLTFDDSTGDLYVQKQSPQPEGYYRLTAESDYQQIEGPFSTSNFLGIFSNNIRDFVFDGATSRLYVARWHYQEKTPGNNIPYNLVYGLEPDGQFLEVFPENQTSTFEQNYMGVDVNEDNGDVFVADRAGGNVIRVFSSVVVPDVTTGDQTANDEISGTVNRAGAGPITDCYFEYATDAFFDGNGETYDQEIACEPATAFDEDRTVTATVPGLTNETIYHYRLVAKNANGEGTGSDRILEPHDIEFLKTRPATSITRQTATLHASFVGNGENTTYHFQWDVNDPEDDEWVGSSSSTPVTLTGPTGDTQISEPITGLTAGTVYRFRVIAEAGGKESIAQELTFETSAAIKGITTLPATDVEPTQATLNGSLDPDGYETNFYFEYGKTKSYGQKTPVPPGEEVGTTAPGSTPVETLATNLEPGTTYHFRLVATNESGLTKGGDQVFTTPQAPSVNGFSSRNVTADSAELTAQIDPNGFLASAYFEYGTTLNYGSKIDVPASQLSSPTGPQDVVVAIEGLSSSTYHFRLVATNQWGETITEDQTFDFLAPIGCPNHSVRQQTGAAYLPDCRAYELVSAERAAGASLAPLGPAAPYASSPGRFAYAGGVNTIPGTGQPANGDEGDLYIASRTTSGWVTKYVGMPGNQSVGYSGPRDEVFFNKLLPVPSDLGMNKILIWDWRQKGFANSIFEFEGNNAPYIIDNEGHQLGRLPTNIDEVPGANLDFVEGGYKGATKPSADFTHYFFSTNDLAFAPGGVLGEPGSVYDNDIAADTVTVISKTENGVDIPRDSAGKANEYLRIPAVSRDGSHALMSSEGPNGTVHLYMAVNRGGGSYDHYEVSEGDDSLNHAVEYEGMTVDGSVVYFTSAEQLTADDTDTVTDLYRWSEAGNVVTRVSVGSAGAGNTSACGLQSCDVEVVPNGPEDFNYQQAGFNRDSVMASETGDIYFYSPEQLDGSRGILGKKNLYILRPEGAVHFVGSFEPSSAPTRMNVSPDGAHMAMLSEAKLTSYDNLGLAQMYAYNADTRAIQCVSCPPSGAPATADVEASQNGIFMTADGRTFFATKEALVDRDANGIKDVYEFVDGRPQLISTGTGEVENEGFKGEIGLVGVSLDGTDAFFSTHETLVQEDENGSYLKFYDARTSGGFARVKQAAPCAAADECHGPEASPPAQPVIGTGAQLGGSGNAQPVHRKKKKCRRVKKNGKSVKRCGKKKHRPSRSKRGGGHG
jgi:hypothetical protein